MRYIKILILAVVFCSCDKSDYTSSGGGGGGTVSPPFTPTNVTATATSSTNVNLTWTDNSTTEDGFRIDRKIFSNAYVTIAVLGANVTSYSDASVNSATMYTYRIASYNTGGVSPYSTEVVVTTP
jgi:hypothetical protein